MTFEEVHEVFERLNDEFLRFDRVKNPRHPRPDICAFLMLHDLAPCEPDERWLANSGRLPDMVSASEHDQIWLGTDPHKFAEVVTEENIRDLLRCGVLWDSGNDCLFMFT